MRGRELESHRCLQAFYRAGVTPPELACLPLIETGSETGGLAIYCKPRHKGSLILSQDSVCGILKDGSPCEVTGQYRCLPNQEQELNSITLVTIRQGRQGAMDSKLYQLSLCLSNRV